MLSNTTKVVRDAVTSAPKIITVEHNNIHDAKFFEYAEFVDIAAGETHNIGLLTPSTLYVHYRNEKLVANAEEIEITLNEGSTISGGTTVSAINHNRVSPLSSQMIVRSDVSISTTGTVIGGGYIPGTTAIGGNRSGGDTTEFNEYVLEVNTQYTVVVENKGGDTARVYVSPIWYEE